MKVNTQIDLFKMTAFDQINEIATFAYVSDSNAIKHISVAKPIFRAIMNEQWDNAKFGQMTTQQYEFKVCLKTHGTSIKSWNEWFDSTANSIIRSSAQSVKI